MEFSIKLRIYYFKNIKIKFIYGWLKFESTPKL
jgi:hypothetical protein